MPDWFYRLKGNDELGPIGPSELLQLIRDGVINEDTMIRKDDSNWVPSVQINGLWEAAGRPTAVFSCPHCRKPILKPPTVCGHCHQRITHAVGHLVKAAKLVSRPTSLANKKPSPNLKSSNSENGTPMTSSRNSNAKPNDSQQSEKDAAPFARRSWFGKRKS